MKKNRVIATITGVLLFLSITLTSAWFYSSKNSNQSTLIELDGVVSKIEKREVKEINIAQSQVDVTDVKGNKYQSFVGSDPTRELLIDTIREYNRTNTSAPIKYTQEPVSNGWGWIILINALFPALFFIMWAATLAVIVYAVRTLSRNKS